MELYYMCKTIVVIDACSINKSIIPSKCKCSLASSSLKSDQCLNRFKLKLFEKKTFIEYKNNLSIIISTVNPFNIKSSIWWKKHYPILAKSIEQ